MRGAFLRGILVDLDNPIHCLADPTPPPSDGRFHRPSLWQSSSSFGLLLHSPDEHHDLDDPLCLHDWNHHL